MIEAPAEQAHLPMNPAIQLTLNQAFEFLLNVAVVRPVFLWGAPGIGKTALVNRFAKELGLECVSLLGSQLAPEDLLGVPQIDGDCSRFFPPANIVRREPFVLFLDELNAASHEIQKAFYSLILDQKVGEYRLPKGTLVIGAGNRAKDAAIVKPMPSALINRLAHIHLRADHRQWLDWAVNQGGIHPWVVEYLQLRPDHLWSEPPKHEEPFSTPRSWHMLSDALHSFSGTIDNTLLEALAFGLLSPPHAGQFKGFLKQIQQKHTLAAILKGDAQWPNAPGDRDILYFLAQSLRGLLRKELPQDEAERRGEHQQLAMRAKDRLKELARISVEIAQSVLAEDDEGRRLPTWFLVEVARDLPRLAGHDKA
jgi:hypothetical protein